VPTAMIIATAIVVVTTTMATDCGGCNVGQRCSCAAILSGIDLPGVRCCPAAGELHHWFKEC
ncbi:hypothetical protein U1Q18_036056, partial [Sarracenia purpurea var. burkii]